MRTGKRKKSMPRRVILVCIVGLSLTATMLLSGCGPLNGKSDYISYQKAFPAHDQAEAKRITAQSKAIFQALASVKTNTPAEKMMMGVFAIQAIGRLAPTRLRIIKPTTGYDVLNNNLSSMMNTLLAGFVGWQAFDTIKTMAATPGYVFNLGKGDLNSQNSFNPSVLEQHQTYSTNSNLSSTAPIRNPINTTTSTDTLPATVTP